MMKRYFFLILGIIGAFMSGCNHQDEDLVPSYIYIDTITVSENNDVNEGSLSHNITDAWVYVDNQLLGAFELPATIPVLKEGEVSIIVKAGIKLNGIASTRVPYPFYDNYETDDVVLTKDAVVELSPEVQYNDDCTIQWSESFEDGTYRLKNDGDTVMFYTSTANAFEGASSGRIFLDTDDTFYEATSDTGYAIPSTSEAIFLEANFKTDHAVIVGLYADNPATSYQNPILVFNETDVWKKIYINLTTVILNSESATSFRIYFEVDKEEGETATVDLDNLKLIHF